MDVECVQFGGAILDDPVFHVALLDDDIRHARSGSKGVGVLAFDGEVKGRGAVGIVRVEQLLGEVELAHAHRSDISQPGQRRRAEAARARRRASSAAPAHRLRR